MKMIGIPVKILSQEAVEFMQFDPMQKIEEILRDVALRILPDNEKRNYLNYGFYLQHSKSSENNTWLEEEKKLSDYKISPAVRSKQRRR
jgi:hypothetical protein